MTPADQPQAPTPAGAPAIGLVAPRAGKSTGRRGNRTSRRTAAAPVYREIAEGALGSAARGPDPATVPILLPAFDPPAFPSRVFDISNHGARGDGAHDCTEAINRAIEACADAGGGRVLIPAGRWLSAAIHLRSGVDLHLADGATLSFIPDPGRYLPAVFVRWNGQECYNYSPLIYAHRCVNVAITGRGTILGRGESWWHWKKREQQSCEALYRMVLRDVPVRDRVLVGPRTNGRGVPSTPLRPQLIAAIECDNVLLENVSIGEGGPFWSVHVAYCRNVTIRGLRVNAPEGPNTNGVVIDSSANVLVEDCDIRSNDDCLCLKSGLNEDGWRVGRPTENVLVRRVRCTGGHGGITIGSEMSGGVRNVLVHDCHYDGLTNGIRLKAARGRGGVVENVWVQNITMGRIDGDAIQMTTEYSTFTSPEGRPPTYRNIHIRGINCEHARTAARLVGQADCAIQDVTLEHLNIVAEEGLLCSAGSGIRLLDVRITPRFGPVLSVRDGQDVTIRGLHTIPTASVFLDVRGRRTRNIRISGEPNGSAGATRPAVVLGLDVPRDVVVHE